MEHPLHPRSHCAPSQPRATAGVSMSLRASFPEHHIDRVTHYVSDPGSFEIQACLVGRLFISQQSRTPLCGCSVTSWSSSGTSEWPPRREGRESSCHKHLCVGFVQTHTPIFIPLEVSSPGHKAEVRLTLWKTIKPAPRAPCSRQPATCTPTAWCCQGVFGFSPPCRVCADNSLRF